MTEDATSTRPTSTAPTSSKKPKSDPAFAERLKVAMDRVNIPTAGRAGWVSRLLSVDPSYGGFTMSGHVRPSFEKTRLLARRLGVSHEWLREGRGPMLSGNAPLELVEPMVLAYVPAKKVPAGAILVSEQEVVPYAEYTYLSQRLVDAEDRLEDVTTPTVLNGGDPRRADDDMHRTPTDWAAKATLLVADAMQKTSAGVDSKTITAVLNQAFDSVRAWAFSLKGGQRGK